MITSAMAGEPTTLEGRVNRNAFPLARYGEKYSYPPKEVESELRARIAEALTPVRLAPASWFRAALGTAQTFSNRMKILDSYGETEIWVCNGGTCSGCPGNETSGCILSSVAAGGVGVVALIHPCLYGEGKCPRGSPTALNGWIQKIVLGVAYYKSGFPKDGAAFRKALIASGDWIKNTSQAVNQLVSSCPGPYDARSLKFLFEVESVTLPNPALERCGRKYLDSLINLPDQCATLNRRNKEAWDAFVKKQIHPSADILRCDAYCMRMLCRTKEVSTVFTRFSDKPILLLGDGACEGENPKKKGQFLHSSLPRELRAKLETTGCLPAEETGNGVSPNNGEGGLSDGPDVQLVE